MGTRIVVAGASGLIGRALMTRLIAVGYDVHTLVRRSPQHEREHEWHPERATIDPEVLRGAGALVSLGGASVGKMPWTRAYREELRASRVIPTRLLADTLLRLGDEAPSAWLAGSAVGFYGSRPGELLDETSGVGETFLAGLCADWETEALRAREVTRVALLRTAPVIHADGVLKPMITLTKLGLGGPLGRGTQHWPWISLDDEVRAIVHVLEAGVSGPINLTGPSLNTANAVGAALAHTLQRPFLLPAPACALRAVLGRDAADSLLLADAMVLPLALERSGFEFLHRTPAEAVRAALQSA